MTVTLERHAQRLINDSMSIQERVAVALQSYGKKDVYQTVDDISGKTGIPSKSVYQALYRMASKGQITFIRESTGNGFAERIVGFTLNKLDSTVRIYNIAGKSAKGRIIDARPKTPVITAITQYMEKKTAVEKARNILNEAGLDGESMLAFETDPMGEEALSLLKELVETKKRLLEVEIDIKTLKAQHIKQGE